MSESDFGGGFYSSVEDMREEVSDLPALREHFETIVPEMVDYDPETTAVVPRQNTAPATLQQADMYYGAGALDITDAQRAKLLAPIPPTDLEILPTGEVYLPQVDYRRRLNDAVGVGRWALRPLGNPARQDDTVIHWYGLFIDGKFAAAAFGEADYIPSNRRSSYGTALESAKSNALMRCCKDIGIALECWDKDFTNRWKRQFAAKGTDGKWYKKEQPDNQFTGAGSVTTAETRPGPSRDADNPPPPERQSAPTNDAPASGNSLTSPMVIRVKRMYEAKRNTQAKGGIQANGTADDGGAWSFQSAEVIEAAMIAEREKKPLRIWFEVNEWKGKVYRNVVNAEVVG